MTVRQSPCGQSVQVRTWRWSSAATASLRSFATASMAGPASSMALLSARGWAKLCGGGLPNTTAVLMSNDSLEGRYGGRAREQEMLGGYGALGGFDGKVTEEIGLSLGGLPDNFAGQGGDDVLEGFDVGQTASQALTEEPGMVEGLYGGPPKVSEEIGLFTGGLHDSMASVEGVGVLEGSGAGQIAEQAVSEELGASEGLGGVPPDPGAGAWGLLRWCCLWPSWRQGLRGVRVGEASHPGPGGGAAATEHRRQEHQMQQALVSIIKLLMSVVASLAGDDNPVKQQMAGVRHLLGVLRAGQDSGQEIEQQQPPPWRQVRFEEEPDVSFYQAEGDFKLVGVKGGKGKTAIEEGKGKGKSPGKADGKGQGKGAEGKGAKAKAKVGGEGKQGKAAKQSGAKGDFGKQGQTGAQARTTARPKLRAQDWHGSILDYDAVCTQLNSVAGPVLIWVRDAEQADAMSQMLLGAGAKCTARMVWKAATGTLKISVELDGDIAIETFSFVDYTTAGVPPPAFKQAAATAKKVPVALARDFVTKEAWAQAVAAPRAAIQKWSREAVKVGNEPFVKDAWGFAEEEAA